jgi:predicted phosphoribosyltransferase
MCVVEIEAQLAHLVVGAVIAAMLSRRKNQERTTLASLPDALLARVANLAIDDLRRARSDYRRRREIAEQKLNAYLKLALFF